MLPHIVYAAGDPVAYAQGLLAKINSVILFPLISLMMGVAFLYFLYGALQYARSADNEKARTEGRTHLLYGVIGMFVMLSAYSILAVAAGTFGLTSVLRDNTPGGGTSNIAPASGLPSGASAPGTSNQNTNTPYSNSGPASGSTYQNPNNPYSNSGPASGSTYQNPNNPYGNSGATSSAGTNTASLGQYQYAYNELVSNGTSPSLAQSIVMAFQLPATKSSFQNTLNTYVSNGLLSQATADQIMVDKFGSN